MIKYVFSIFATTVLLFSVSLADATTLVDTLNKTYKKSSFPHDTVQVRITIQTPITYLSGNNKSQDANRSLMVHEKLVDTFKSNGWSNEDKLLTNVLDAGIVELELGEGMSLQLDKTLRLKAFVHQCESPMFKYRGGDITEFFNKIIEKSEYCFTYDEHLQGKNWPY